MINLNSDDCVAMYLYGSRVYGTEQSDSDYDYVFISKSAIDTEMKQGYGSDYKIISPSKFQELIDEHNITALECLFLSNDNILKSPSNPWIFELNLKNLRHSISTKTSHSWVKAKKKMESPYEWAEEEFHRGKKSLFHSFRILLYGIQIAEHGKIVDYSSANHIFEDIMTDPSKDWNHYYLKWKKVHNGLSTQFKVLAPKTQ